MDTAEPFGLAAHFMGMGRNRVRFVGQGQGPELDELPVFAKGLRESLVPGMFFVLEPKFVFPEGAVGIKNTHVVTENGVEMLTRAERGLVDVGEKCSGYRE